MHIFRNVILLGGLALALAGCQGIVGTNGQVTGVTVPPGCKGSITFSYPMPQGAIMLTCDETGTAAAAPATPHALAAVPMGAPVTVAPQGAHITIERQ